MPKLRGHLSRWLLLLGSALVGVVAAEMILRLSRPGIRQPFQVRATIESERGKFCEYHPLLGWAAKPDVEGVLRSIDVEHRVLQNRWGFRGKAHPEERTGRPRVLVLGDSFVWGYGVEEGQLFTDLLERESVPPIEVINLGVSGYGTDQELLLWREQGRRFRPDVVLLVVTPYTDLLDNVRDERYGYPKPLLDLQAPGPLRATNVPVPRRDSGLWEWVEDAPEAERRRHALQGLAQRSALVAAALRAAARSETARRRLEERAILPRRVPGAMGEEVFYQAPPDPRLRYAWKALLRIVRELRAEVKADGAVLVVAVVPSVVQVYDALWSEMVAERSKPPRARWARERPGRILTRALAGEVTVVDLLPRMREAAQQDPYLYYPWNRHWTQSGHRVAADALQETLASALATGGTAPD
jgi:hypothetical protein